MKFRNFCGKAAKKISDRHGITLSELLCSVILLVLISAMVVTGISMGLTSYRESTTASEANMLLLTVKNAMTDELRFASSVELYPEAEEGDNNVDTFFSTRYGYVSFSITDGFIMIGDNLLLSSKMYPKGMSVSIDTFRFDTGTGIFTVGISAVDTLGAAVATSVFEVERISG